ncbi:MAG TPA: 50S ribosomal protein L4 [Acidiferrobacteraceae bacterium]|nr:50S ribosomal protein L4 [Acidiferrobacteraceae bacterium]
MQLSIIEAKGGKAGDKLTVSDATFGVKYKESLIHQALVAFQAGQRSGTRAQKNRAAVRGGGAKPWRQKGTGNARAGTIRSPIWRGGGRTFPAQNTSFKQKFNRKMYRGAIRAILSELLRQDRLLVVDKLVMESPKTKILADTLNTLGAMDALIVIDSFDMNLALSGRNLVKVDVRDVPDINPDCLLRHEKVVMTVDALKKIEEWLG